MSPGKRMGGGGGVVCPQVKAWGVLSPQVKKRGWVGIVTMTLGKSTWGGGGTVTDPK